jgi:hypothetical protein
MSESNPIRLFVTHAWEESPDYLRVFEYLESAPNFFYRNLSMLEAPAAADREARRELLRAQIRGAEVCIALASLASAAGDWLSFGMTFAQSARKPVLLLPSFGGRLAVPRSIAGLASEEAGWDQRSLVDALRRLARGDRTDRWDVIEFKLD